MQDTCQNLLCKNYAKKLLCKIRANILCGQNAPTTNIHARTVPNALCNFRAIFLSGQIYIFIRTNIYIFSLSGQNCPIAYHNHCRTNIRKKKKYYQNISKKILKFFLKTPIRCYNLNREDVYDQITY